MVDISYIQNEFELEEMKTMTGETKQEGVSVLENGAVVWYDDTFQINLNSSLEFYIFHRTMIAQICL